MLCKLERALCLRKGMFYATAYAKGANRNPTGQSQPKARFFEGDHKTAYCVAHKERATGKVLEPAPLQAAASHGVARPRTPPLPPPPPGGARCRWPWGGGNGRRATRAGRCPCLRRGIG